MDVDTHTHVNTITDLLSLTYINVSALHVDLDTQTREGV